MNKWRIGIILKNGKQLNGYYSGKELNSTDVAKALFEGNNNEFKCIKGETPNTNLLYRLGDVSAVIISIAD